MKSTVKVGDTIKINVALFARAWIEMIYRPDKPIVCRVALFARAWIEITIFVVFTPIFKSPSLRGRGLKF